MILYLSEESKYLKSKVITYGIQNHSDIMSKNIEMSSNGSTFDLYVMNEKIQRVNVKLLGIHNVMNYLGCVGVLKAMGINLDYITELTENIHPIEHRLNIKFMDGLKIIDDSFNSNVIGFKNAIDILNMMKEKRIVITPGIIEQGNNSYNMNYELGGYMADKIDFAILVEKNSCVLKKGLVDAGFNENNIIEKKSFKEAWNYIKNNFKDTDKIILIENDLPSIYLK